MPDTHAKILALYSDAQKAAANIAQSLPSISNGGSSGTAIPSGSPSSPKTSTTPVCKAAANIAQSLPSISNGGSSGTAIPSGSPSSPKTSTAPVCNASPLVDRPTAWHIAGQAYVIVARNVGPLLLTSAGYGAVALGAEDLLFRKRLVNLDNDFLISFYLFIIFSLTINTVTIWIRRADGRDCASFLAYFGLSKHIFKIMLLALGFTFAPTLIFEVGFDVARSFTPEGKRFAAFVIVAAYLFMAYLVFRIFFLYIVSIATDHPLSVRKIWRKGRNNLLQLFGVIVFCVTPGFLVCGILLYTLTEILILGISIWAVGVAFLAGAISSLASLGVGLQKFDESL